MDHDEAIRIAKNKKSMPDQLGPLCGLNDEVDLLLAKHPNSTTEMPDKLGMGGQDEDFPAQLRSECVT